MPVKYDGKYWAQQIKAAWKYRQDNARADEWAKWRGYYEGNWGGFHVGMNNTGILPVNLIFAYGRTFISKLVSSHPSVVVKPLKAQSGGLAMLVEQVCRQLILNLPLVQNMRRVVQDTFLLGTGFIKRGYNSQFGYFDGKADGKTGSRGERLEHGSKYRDNMPWAMWQQLEDSLVPYGTVRDEDVWFHAFLMFRRVEDMKADPKLKNTKDLVGTARPIMNKNMVVNQDGTSTSQSDPDKEAPPAEWFAYWEIHDMRRTRVIWLDIESEKILLDDVDILTSEGEPVGYALRLNDNNRCWWGLSDTHNLEPQQLEINDIRTQQTFSRRLSNLKFLVRDGTFKPEELLKLLSGAPGCAVNVNGDLDKSIKDIKPAVALELSQLSEEVRKDMREMIGLSRNQQGVFAGSRTTASEVGVVSAASEGSMEDRRNLVNALWSELMLGLIDSAKRFWKEKETIALIGPEGLPFWVDFKGSDLEGKFSIDIDVNAGLPFSQISKRQELQSLMQAMGPENMSPGLMEAYASTFPYLDKSKIFQKRDGMGGAPENPASAKDFNQIVNMGGGQSASVRS